MEHIFTALLPIFLLILIGNFFKRIKFPSNEFWENADKLTYFVLMPSLLTYKLATASLEGIDGFNFVLSGVLVTVVLTLVLMFFNKFIKRFQGSSFTSIYQGTIRFNTYVFLGLVDAVLGDKGLVLAALLITFMIPLINVFCISIFALYASSNKITISSFISSIVKNPLILACIIGGGINYFGITLFTPVEKTLAILSSAALPLGLLSVGVGLHLSAIKEAKSELVIALILKLIAYPFIIFAIGKFLGISDMAIIVLAIFGSIPTAPSSYILARQLGGDLKLMSAIITFQILFSIITISGVLLFLAN